MKTGDPDLPELYQFAFSHYNEKARWALDYKGIPHRRRSLLPGPHMPIMKKLTGRSETPALKWGGEVIAGSAAIIDRLEREVPEPALYPEDPDLRLRALELQRWFDDEVGGPVRCAFFFDAIRDGGYFCDRFSHGYSRPAQLAYRASFPVLKQVLRKVYSLDAQHAEQGRATTRRALDRLAAEIAATGYLVGDSFTVADLAAASLMQLVVFPPEFPVPVPEPRSPGYRTWLARWESHPAVAWILETYARHRGRSAEVGN